MSDTKTRLPPELPRALLPIKQAVEDIMMRRHHDARSIGVGKLCLLISAHLGLDAGELDDLDNARLCAVREAFARLGLGPQQGRTA